MIFARDSCERSIQARGSIRGAVAPAWALPHSPAAVRVSYQIDFAPAPAGWGGPGPSGVARGERQALRQQDARPTRRGAGNAAGLAGPSLAHAVLGHERLNDQFTTRWGQRFRLTMSVNAWCICARSAYMRLSLAFSSCNWRSHARAWGQTRRGMLGQRAASPQRLLRARRAFLAPPPCHHWSTYEGAKFDRSGGISQLAE